MNRLFSIILIFLTGFGMAAADEFAMQKAIADFVKSKDVTVSRQLLKDFDPATANTPRREWQITHYSFEVKQGKSKKLMERLVKAYEKDVESPLTDAAYQLTGVNMSFTIEYSSLMAPLRIGSTDDEVIHSLLITGAEEPNVNTVIAIIWHDSYERTDKPAAIGDIYIIYRDPTFVKVSDNADIYTQRIDNENVRRLEFFSQKYTDLINLNQTGVNIVKALIFAVDDIIRNGSALDKDQARNILDYMLSVTPGPTDMTPLVKREDLQENAKTLLNLIQRLSADYNPAKYESTPNTFTLEGHIDEGLWDIGYYIYKSDDAMTIDTNESELIKADGQNFFYKTELEDVALGRVRALFKDGTVCSAWIDMLFVPGETAELQVHNGSYTLTGTGFYKELSNAIRSCMYGTIDDRVAYALEHVDEPGALCIIFKEGGLSKEQLQTIYDAVPESIKSSAYGVYLRKHL